MAKDGAWRPAITAVIATIVLVGGYALFGVRPSSTLTEQRADHEAAAVRLRDTAKHACEKERFRDCLSLLDEAKKLDEGGDNGPEVQDERRRATEGVRAGAAPSADANARTSD